MARLQRHLKPKEGRLYVSRRDVSDYINEAGDKSERAGRVSAIADSLGVSKRTAQRYGAEEGKQRRGLTGFTNKAAEALEGLGIGSRERPLITRIEFFGEVQVSGDKRDRGKGRAISLDLEEEQSDELYDLLENEGERAAEMFLLNDIYGIGSSARFTGDKGFRIYYDE